MFRRAVTIALMTLAAAGTRPGLSAPLGLNVIATADVLGAHECLVEYQRSWEHGAFGGGADEFFTQFCLGPRLEGGVDLGLGGANSYAVFNLKWVLLEEGPRFPALALGVLDIASGDPASLYVIVTRELWNARLHVGALSSEEGEALLVGFDQVLRGDSILQADYVGGSGNYLSAGMSFPFSEGTWLTTAYLHPNSSGASGQWLLNVSFFGFLH